MSIQNLTENVLFVTLSPERQLKDELKAINEKVVEQNSHDVIIDFY